MRGIALVLAAISAVAIAMPQFRLTAKEYEGFQRALDGRIPVAIASGRQLYTAVDTNADNFVVVDFGGAATSGELVAPAPAPFDAPAPSPIIILDDVDLRSPESSDRSAIEPSTDLGKEINAIGQGVLDFGEDIGFALSKGVAAAGDVAEDILRDIASLTGALEDEPAAAAGRALTPAVPEAAVIIIDEAPSFRSLDTVADDTVAAVDTPVIPAAAAPEEAVEAQSRAVPAISPEPSTAATEATSSVTVTEAVTESVAPAVTESVAPAVTEAAAPVVTEAAAPAVIEAVVPAVTEAAAPLVTEAVTPSVPALTDPVDETLNEIVPEAAPPQEEIAKEIASAPAPDIPSIVADSRSAPAPVEDTPVAIIVDETAAPVEDTPVAIIVDETAAPFAADTAVAPVVDAARIAPVEAEVAAAPAPVEAGVPLPAAPLSNDIVPAPEEPVAVPVLDEPAAVPAVGVPLAVQDTAFVLAPAEGIVAPAPPTGTEGVSLADVILRRKRQLIDDEEPISNARQIGSGLGTLAGLFGSQQKKTSTIHRDNSLWLQ